MKFIWLQLVLSGLFFHPLYSQNTLNSAGLTAATPSAVAFSLRKLSTSYSGPAIKVRRTSDNAEGIVAFDGSGTVSASSLITFTAAVTVGAAFGTAQTGTISSGVAKTGTVNIIVNKTGTITTSFNTTAVTGVGSSFTTDLAVGDQIFNSANLFLGIVAVITSNTSLTLNNYATSTQTSISYKTTSAKITGIATSFTTELTAGDFIFNSANVYLGTVASVVNATTATLNAIDAVASSAITFKGSSATITGSGTSFTSLSPGNLLISNNITLGIISSITNATSLILVSKAGASVAGLAFKSATGTITFSSFYTSASVFVNTWYDQSGNARNAIQVKSNNQPRIVNAGTLYTMGAKTSMEFSFALSAFLQSSAAASYLNNTPYTLNKVTAEAASNPANQFPFATTGGSGPTNTVSHFGYRSPYLLTLAQLSHDHTFNAAAGTMLESHTAVKNSAAASQMYKNAVSLGSASNGVAAYLSNVGLLNIGLFIPTSSYYNGSVSELIAFPSALSSTDAGLLNNNQLVYYNIGTMFWSGAVSSDWNNTGNWSTGILPTATSPSIAWIPAGKPNYPVISSGTAIANSISVDAGASLTVNSTGILQVAGTINNLGTCTASSGTVEYIGTAPQGIGAATFTGNVVQNLIISNSTGLNLNGDLSVSNNLTFATGKLSIGTFTLTIGGILTNTISGGLTGNSFASLVVTSAVGSTLSFDQTTNGTTNALKNLTINSAGQVNTLSNNLILTAGGTTTFTAGKLAIASNTLTIRGAVVNTLSGGIRGSSTSNMVIDGTASPTVSFDQTTAGSSNALSTLTLNCTGQTVSLNNALVIATTLTLTAGTLADGGNQLTSTGTLNLVAGTFKLGGASSATVWPAFTTNNISTTGTVEYAAGVAQTVSGVPVYQNLTISATAGATAATNLTVNNVLNLSVANPSATLGSLSMSTFTLNMGASSTTTGPGDVTGIIKRTTILPNITYTMGNQYVSVVFPNVGTLPTQMSIKISIGAAPSWQPGAILRTYDFIQTGGSGTKAVITSHYLDAELNGNVENNLVDYSFRFTGSVLTEHGKSDFNSTQNWIVLSNVNVAFFSSSFGDVQLSFDESTLTTLLWNGSTSTSWITATNWTPNGGPSTNTVLIIPDAATTPNDPSLPATASNGSLTIQTGGIVNSDPGAQLILNNAGLDWSNSGTFNGGTSTIIFSSATATMNGTTNFNNVVINSGASLQMSTNNIMRIGGLITNNGTWSPGLLNNTVEYNGNNQTIIIPNGSTGAYYNLIVSGTGTSILPPASLNIHGNLSLNGAFSSTGNAITMNGAVPQSVNGSSSLTVNNFTVNNTVAPVTMNQNLAVNGALTFTAGKLVIGANTLTIAGSILNTVANGISGSLTSNLTVNGSVSPAITMDQSVVGISNALNNFTINSSGQTISLSSDLEINGNLLFTAGKLAIGSNTLNIKNNITNTSSGGLKGSIGSNLIISGNLQSPSLSFDQTIPGTTNLLNNFTINSNAQSAVLSNPVLIGGVLGLTDGNVFSTAINTITLSATASISGGSSNSFVNGPITRNTNSTADYFFPVGKTNHYDPLTITPASAADGIYSAELFQAIPPAGTLSPSLTAIATDEYWDVSISSGPDVVTTFPYHADNTWSAGSPGSTDLIVVAGLIAGIWTPEHGDAIPGNTGSGLTPLKTKLQTVSTSFTFAYGGSTALPLTLLSFKGKRMDPVAILQWTTTGEYNVAQFQIERSDNGTQFSKIGSVTATNSSQNKTYQWTDSSAFTGSNYYRLKMMDNDGIFNYSPVIKIDMGTNVKGIFVYPNPVTGHSIHLQLIGQRQGLYTVSIYNTLGARVMNTLINHDGTNHVELIPIRSFIQSGSYYLEVNGPGTERKTFQIIFE